MIENVIICGLGAVGVTYASKLKEFCNLKILADEKRVQKYKKNPPVLNGFELEFDYILPTDCFEADLIIISTKASGLENAINYLRNFVGKNTIIISLLNGISSEKEISKTYGWDNLLYSYFIGHSAVRKDNIVTQDGIGKIVFGGEKNKVKKLEEFFKKSNIDYEIPEDIIYSLWLKFAVNIYINQISAVMNLTMGEMKKSTHFKFLAELLLDEVVEIAQKQGVNNSKSLKQEALEAINLMCDEGKSSMLQDILSGRKTEVDIFAGEVLNLAKEFNIQTPYNKMMYNMIKVLEEKSL